MNDKELYLRAKEVEEMIVYLVKSGETQWREIKKQIAVDKDETSLFSYCFYHALNEGRIVMGADRKLRMP